MRTTRLIASVLALVLVAVSILPQQVAHAQQPPLGEQESIAVLQSYNIVRGDTSGNLNLDAQLTRAQAATIFVRAMNADELAPLMAEDVPFTDAKGHWAAGEIAIAARLGLMKGDGNGLFRPEAEITYAEIFTVLLRMLKREPTGPWSPELVMLHANQLPIVPPGINGRAVAIRRTIFWALAAAVTSVPVEGHPNLLRKHIDQEPPTLGLDLAAATTADSSFAITGTVVGGTRVLVNGNPASLDLSSGRFTYKAALESGTNTLVVEAFDAAGNKAVKEMTVEKQAVIARLTITGPKTLLANTSTRLTVEAKDSKGNLLSADGVDVEMTGEVATFNRTNWTLVTGSKAGKGTLTLRAGSARATYSFEVVAPSSRANALRILPINGDRPLALQKEETVTVQVVDSAGRVVADDFGRVITLSTTGQVPLTIDPVSPITEKGVALFKVTGVEVGHATLSASTPGLSTVNRPLEVLTARRIMLVPSAKSLMPDGTSSVTIKAILQDENGRNTNNDTGTDIQIHLTATGTDSVLDGSYLTIPKGRADSGSASVKLTAGIAPGITTIRGTTAHPYAIQTLEFPVDTPLPGVRLEVIPTATSVVPGGQTTVKVRVVDGSNRLVTSGSYAFQLAATTSNNDPLHEGLPDGVTISYPNSPYYPVNDGRAVTDPQNDPYSVIGRTERGEATVTLRYNRSGIVQVKPVLLPATTEAYHPNAGMGPASASTGLLPMPADIYFQGAAARLELTVDSAIGTGLKGGALGGAGTVTLKARVVDTFGATVPGFADLITITRLTSSDGVSNFDGVQEKRAVNGVAVFTIQAYDQAGVDLYRVSTGTFTSEPVTVAVRKTTAFQPAIVAIRGVKEGGLSPVTGFVGAEADYMEIQLQSQAVDEKEQQYWVQAKVYRSGESSPFYSQAIDLRNPLPIIRIPRAVLKTGQYRYSVVINNGFGDTKPSLTLDETTSAVVASYNDNFRLTGARFDAQTGRLTLITSGLLQTGVVDKKKLSIVKGSSLLPLGGDEVTVVTPISSSQVVLDLGTLAGSINADTFHGAVSLRAEAGWYIGDASSSVVARGYAVPVTPLALIASGALDVYGKRLYLYGEGFTQGTVQWNLVKIHTSDTESVALRPGYDQVLQLTDDQVILKLSDTTYSAIAALNGANLYVAADVGWIQTSGVTGRAPAITGTGHAVLLRVLASSAAYDPATDTLTIRAAGGFQDMQINPTLLRFTTGPGSTTWSPGTGTGAVVATADDAVSITLAPDDAAAFEAAFTGKNVYLNTLVGWLTDSQGREAVPIPDYSILMFVP